MVQRKAFIAGKNSNASTKPNQRLWSKPVPANLKGGKTAWVTHPVGRPNEIIVKPNSSNNFVVRPDVPQMLKRMPPAVQVAYELHQRLPAKYQVSPENVLKVFKNVKVPGNLGGGVSSGGGNSAMNSSYGLSKAPNPKPVYLNSGIMPNAYANDYMKAKQNLCIPMHVSNVYLGIPTSALNSLYSYFTSTLAFDIQTRAQANVGFNLNVSTDLTPTLLLTAFNSGIRALQIYYYYASILSYESNPQNKNDGMINLRSLMTPQIISDLTQLGRRLEDTPMPPRIVEWVRYMSMNFLSGDTQGAPIIKLGIQPEAMGTSPSLTLVSDALATLQTSTNNTVFALLRRAIPQWRIGTLYDVPTVPVYDKNFLTIFANTGVYFRDSASVVQRFPTMTNSTDAISYNSYHNRLDGAAYAMCSAYRVSSGGWAPGICQPYQVNATNYTRQSWCDYNGTGAAWVNSADWYYATQSRQESYQVNSPTTGAAITAHLPGADKAQGVSIDSLTQTAQNFLDFLFNVEAIPVKGKLSNFNNNGRDKV